jgi:hypothetical protein
VDGKPLGNLKFAIKSDNSWQTPKFEFTSCSVCDQTCDHGRYEVWVLADVVPRFVEIRLKIEVSYILNMRESVFLLRTNLHIFIDLNKSMDFSATCLDIQLIKDCTELQYRQWFYFKFLVKYIPLQTLCFLIVCLTLVQALACHYINDDSEVTQRTRHDGQFITLQLIHIHCSLN